MATRLLSEATLSGRTVGDWRDASPVLVTDAPSSAAREALALPKTAVEYAYERRFNGPDGTVQLRIVYTPKAASEWRMSGGNYSAGPVLAAWSDSQTNVNGTFAAKGTGGFYFGNGGGVLGAVIDNGSGERTDGYAALTPGKKGLAGVVAAQSPSGTAIGLALSPFGTGAITRDDPDGAISGGIARGSYAVDWQGQRTNATTVAQGSWSTIGGGMDNLVQADAAYTVVAGGFFNRLGGLGSWCPGGSLGDDRGRTGTGVWGSGQFSGGGDSISSEGLLRASVTDATPTRLRADSAVPGSANVFNLPNNGLYTITALLQAFQSGGSAGTAGDASWRTVSFAVKRGANAAATALVGSVATLASGNDAAASGWVWTIAADTTLGAVSITFTGEANKTIRTNARLMAVEVVR